MSVTTAALLAWRMLQTRPRRTLLLLFGYGLGVAVMVALLAVGDALLVQAQDKDVVSGGDVVLLPEGIDPEVLKVGGVTGLFLSIPNARYLVRQVLLGPRFADTIAAVSPELTNKLMYLRTRRGTYAAQASADLPSLSRQTRSVLHIDSAAWKDGGEDRAWVAPGPAAQLEAIDRFHAPIQSPEGRSWAEWWYFNFTTPEGLYGYISFIVDRDRKASVRVTVRLPGGQLVRWEEFHPATALPLAGGTFRAGPHSVELRQGTYRIHLARPDFAAELEVRPIPGLYFPPLERQAGTFRSGYVVPVLRASVKGVVRASTAQFSIDAVGYHDHNWGVWQAVTWEWGTASTPDLVLLTGLLRHPSLGGQDMFVGLYAADEGHPGLLATLRAEAPRLEDWHIGPRLRGVPLRVPGRLSYRAINDAGDRLDVQVRVEDLIATPVGSSVFLQIRGLYGLYGQVGGRQISAQTQGFAETFIPLPRTR